MELYINQYRVDDILDVSELKIKDSATGVVDSMSVQVSADPNGVFVSNIEIGDELQAVEGNFDGGIMFSDTVKQQNKYQHATAVSSPISAKAPRSQSWQKVTLIELLQEIAGRYELELKTFNIKNHTYEWVEQKKQTDFGFLAHRCMLESYGFKVYNKTIVVYDAAALEKRDPQVEFSVSSGCELEMVSDEIFDGIKLTNPGLIAQYNPSGGARVLEVESVPFFSIGEGERFCRGIFRAKNRKRKVLRFSDELDTSISAGTVAYITGEGNIADKYIYETVEHDLIGKNTNVIARAVYDS